MTYNIEHTARLIAPKEFDTFKRENNKLGDGIHVVWGIKENKTSIQTIRFDKNKYSAKEAKTWLSDHNYNPIEWEVAAGESAMDYDETNLIGDCIPLIEKVNNANIMDIKIIEPGWGSTGYYKEEALKRDAGKYTSGTKMFWNHPTESEDKERPERDLNDLAGVLITDGYYDESGKKGKGVYARAAVFNNFKSAISEIHDHIGLSHIAKGVGKKGEAEGKKGVIIEGINEVKSVDFVTQAGAGGAIVKMFESLRNKQEDETNKPQKGGSKEEVMSETEKTELENLRKAKAENDTKITESQKQIDESKKQIEAMNAEIAKLQESDRKTRAKEIAIKELETSKLPKPAQLRIAESVSQNPPVKDGVIDLDTFKTILKESIESEQKYLSEIITSTGAKITGMGESKTDKPDAEADRKKLRETWKSKYVREGKTAQEAEKLVALALGE